MQSLLGLTTLQLLVLLGAAVVGWRRRPPKLESGERPSFAVLVPAHDEELVISRTLIALEEQNYPRDRFRVFVIADNCQDRTARLARSIGATVWERQDRWRPGKGQALAWSLGRLRAEWPDVDAVAVVDADCQASRNMLDAMATRLQRGAAAVQVQDLVANPTESWAAGLRFAGFVLVNVIHPLGKCTLGLSGSVIGTGMAFSKALLERQPWDAFTITEGIEYNLRLALGGEKVDFAQEAWVSSAAPTSLRLARVQNLRWESGRLTLGRVWIPKLVTAGIRQRDLQRLYAGLELLIPPQSLIFAGNVASGALALFLRSPTVVAMAVANLLGQGCFVLGGLALVRAPVAVYRALIMAPLLAAWKVWLYLILLAGRGPKTWIRSERLPPAASATGQQWADQSPAV
jgi:cellulose synthase/poly-beta-1,6-N-acetylglucosamine synthase-like glycosyltransferase